MNLKRIVVGVVAIVCSGVFYEVDHILAYYKWAVSMTRDDISSFSHVAEVRFYDNFFSVLLLAIGLWLLLQEVIPYIKSRRKKKG